MPLEPTDVEQKSLSTTSLSDLIKSVTVTAQTTVKKLKLPSSCWLIQCTVVPGVQFETELCSDWNRQSAIEESAYHHSTQGFCCVAPVDSPCPESCVSPVMSLSPKQISINLIITFLMFKTMLAKLLSSTHLNTNPNMLFQCDWIFRAHWFVGIIR